MRRRLLAPFESSTYRFPKSRPKYDGVCSVGWIEGLNALPWPQSHLKFSMLAHSLCVECSTKKQLQIAKRILSSSTQGTNWRLPTTIYDSVRKSNTFGVFLLGKYSDARSIMSGIQGSLKYDNPRLLYLLMQSLRQKPDEYPPDPILIESEAVSVGAVKCVRLLKKWGTRAWQMKKMMGNVTE